VAHGSPIARRKPKSDGVALVAWPILAAPARPSAVGSTKTTPATSAPFPADIGHAAIEYSLVPLNGSAAPLNAKLQGEAQFDLGDANDD
jgi:hypothetical protein